MKVFLRTDMLTLTTPLEEYLTDRFGSLDTENPELWDVYAAGLDELYAAEPALDGVLIRIGEAGRVYDVEGWDYYSALAVTTVDAVRTMLETLTAQAEASDREVIFRTWSVGVGAVGDMHTNAGLVRGGAGRHRLAGADRVDEVHARRLLQLAAAERDARAGRSSAGSWSSRAGASSRTSAPSRTTSGREYQFALQQLLAANDRHRGHLDVDAGRRSVARRADDPVPQGRVLAAVRARHRGRRRARPRPRDRRRGGHRGLGAAVVLGRPGDRRRRSSRRWPSRARRSSRACTSSRSPSSASSRSGSSRRR